MAARFIGKNIRNKVVRPMKNSVKFKNYIKTESEATETVEPAVEVVEEKATKKKNKKKQKDTDMNNDKLTQMEAIVETEVPQRKVKVEKGEKGLYERTENSTILLTEDNKMLLND